ncbi:hypothetical protein FBU30_010104 [Linnemannia zychae]|nr:hypothetical protein FBU30_010104 [Linnemannia zychae]
MSKKANDRKCFRAIENSRPAHQNNANRRPAFLSVENDDDSNTNDEQHHATKSEEGYPSRGNTKGPRRLSRHRYPHAMIHRLYRTSTRNNSPLTCSKTTPKVTTESKRNRRIVTKKRPSRLQRLLQLDDDETQDALQTMSGHRHGHQQLHGKENISNNPDEQDIIDMMNLILDKRLSELPIHFRKDHNTNDHDQPNDSSFEAKTQPQSASPALSPSSSLFPSTLSDWTQSDIDIAKALWKYWEELDAMDMIQAQLERQLDDDIMNDESLGFSTHSPYQKHPNYPSHSRHRRPFKDLLWRKKVTDDSTTSLLSSLKWIQDGIPRPIIHFPPSGPVPALSRGWVAVMPCSFKLVDSKLKSSSGINPKLPLDASAIIFYATTDTDCRGYTSAIDDDNALPPLLFLDALSAQSLISALDSLNYNTIALVTIVKSETDSDIMSSRVNTTPMKTDRIKKAITRAAKVKNNRQFGTPPSSMKDDNASKAASPSVPISRQIDIFMSEIVSIIDSFTGKAVIRARKAMANLGLDSQVNSNQKQYSHQQARKVDGSYYHHFARLLSKKDTKLNADGQQDSAHSQSKEMANGMESGTTSFIIQRHSKSRTRPNRLPQRGQSSSHSQLHDQSQSLMLLKGYAQYQGRQSIQQRLNALYFSSTNRLSLTHPNNTSFSGKVIMVLMSTACGIGIGMFGALLVVVALKVRLFQSRRTSSSGPRSRQAANIQNHAHQQMRENGQKKVIPLGVLESYGVQTVLHASPVAMVLTEVSDKSRARTTLLNKGPKAYAEDVIEMEEGLEDAEARADSRRRRLERRRVNGNGQQQNDEDETEEEFYSGDDTSDINSEGDNDSTFEENNNGDDIIGYRRHSTNEDDNGQEGDQIVPVLRSNRSSVSNGGAVDMEQITAAIMIATRQRSYRRISYNRQGHLNDPTMSLSSPYSLSSSSSSSSSSSGSGSMSGSSSVERGLTSSFSLSHTRTENPRGCTHSHSHSHSHADEHSKERRRRRRKNKKRREDKELGTKAKEKLPFANANTQTMCAICLAEYFVGEQVRTLPCYHQYHQACIDPWLLNIAALCPICKRDLLTPPSCGSTQS